MNLYANTEGDSVIANWSDDELMSIFRKAESDGDDFSCMAILDEVKRRGLTLQDSE